MAIYYVTNLKGKLSHYDISKNEDEILNVLKNADLFEEKDLGNNFENYLIESSDSFNNNEMKNQLILKNILSFDTLKITKDLDKIITNSSIDIISDNLVQEKEFKDII
ncbi:7423_t:CDS:1 [Diversispora eburnea]|uniref:7423_t:CDS:1 n=1 Tax=Diversispora eburnea TaxID=1213867 RepID=A0A9N9A944_9GLOM|nr:7423_t:CDS:1 [Diversispora eburnea]